MRQFTNVSSRYGAPMGRRERFDLPQQVAKARLYRVRLDRGGYDDGGAYWGLGVSLYCLDATVRIFQRAPSRYSAACAISARHPLMFDNLKVRGIS